MAKKSVNTPKTAAAKKQKPQTVKKQKLPVLELREWQRTVILLLLIFFAVGFILWTRQQYQNNFIDSF